MSDADHVAELDALTPYNTDDSRWRWLFPDGSVVERLDADTWGNNRSGLSVKRANGSGPAHTPRIEADRRGTLPNRKLSFNAARSDGRVRQLTLNHRPGKTSAWPCRHPPDDPACPMKNGAPPKESRRHRLAKVFAT